MRTLRKALCLVLVAVMVMGFGAFSVSAVDNLASFSDGSSVSDTYKEAIDLLVGINVVEGMDDGTLNLTGQYTREQAATIVARIKLGVTNANNLRCVTDPFTDVPASRWSAGAIAYCAQSNILDGMGDGSFHPTEPLTGYAFGKMLLCAVGYGQRDEYVGTGWEINVAKDGVKRNIYATADLGAATNEPITRQQAMLMAYNTLVKTEIVKYSTLINDYVSVNNANNISVTGIGSVTSGSVDKAFLMSDNFRNIFLARGPIQFDLNRGYSVYNKDYSTLTEEGQRARRMLSTDDEWIANYTSNVGQNVKISADYGDVGRYAQVWYNRNGKDNAPEAITGFHMVDTKLGSRNDGTPLETLITRSSGNKFIAEPDDEEFVEYYLNGDISTYDEINLASDWRGVDVTLYDSNRNNKVDVVIATVRTVAKLTSSPTISRDGKNITLGGTLLATKELAKVRGYEGLVKDDRIMYVEDADEVIHIEKANVVTGSMTRYNSTDGNIFIGSDSYKISELPEVKSGLFDDIVRNANGQQCNFYLDTCGNIIDYTRVSSAALNYVALLDVYVDQINSINPDARSDVHVKLLKTDGSVVNVVLTRLVVDVKDIIDAVEDYTDYDFGYVESRVEWKDIYANQLGEVVSKILVDSDTVEKDFHEDPYDLFEGLLNRFFSYTVSGNNKYTLTAVANQDSTIDNHTLSNTNAVVRNGVSQLVLDDMVYYANNETTYLYWVPDANTYRVLKGVNNAPRSNDGAMVSVMSNYKVGDQQGNLASVVFITDGEVSDSGTVYFFPSANPLAQIADDPNTNANEKGAVYNVLNTKTDKVEEMVLSEDAAQDVLQSGWYNITKGGGSYPNDYATSVTREKITDSTTRREPGVGVYTNGNGIVTLGRMNVVVSDIKDIRTDLNVTYAYQDDVKVYVVDPGNDYELSVGGKELLATDINDIVYPTSTNSSKKETAAQFVVVKVAEPKIKTLSAVAGRPITFNVEFANNDWNANYFYAWVLSENGSVVASNYEDSGSEDIRLREARTNTVTTTITVTDDAGVPYYAVENCNYTLTLYLFDISTGIEQIITARQKTVLP